MSCGVYLRVESDDDHVFDVPGMHQFHIRNGGNVLDLLVAAHRANSSYNYTSRHITGFGDVVTSLCGLFNEPEENKGWFFYTPPNQIIDKPLNKVELTSGMEVVARYEPFEREEQKAQVNRK